MQTVPMAFCNNTGRAFACNSVGTSRGNPVVRIKLDVILKYVMTSYK